MLANILRGFFFRQHVGSHSKSRQHVGQQMLASNVGQNVVSICAGPKPVIIILICPEANPRDELSQPSISFYQKSHQSQSTDTSTSLRLIPDNLVERPSLHDVVGE